MGDAQPVRKDDPAAAFEIAATETMQAHHVLGRMSVCTTTVEVTDAVAEFFVAARCIARITARLGHPSQHPLDANDAPPRVYPVMNGKELGADDFYFEGTDDKPAITVCAEYLRYLSALLDRSKQTLVRLGYA